MQYASECWCGNSVDESHKVDESKCDAECPAHHDEKCGGFYHLSVYHTGTGRKYTCIYMYMCMYTYIYIIYMYILTLNPF